MTIKEIDEGALNCSDSRGQYLGFPTGVGNRRFSGTDTVALRNSAGIIVDGNGLISPWPIDRFVEHRGNMVALGPWIGDTRPFMGTSPDPEVLSRLIPAIRAVRATGYAMNGLYSRAVRWMPDGGILVYPPKLAEWIREFSPPESWVHPDLTGEPAWSFSLGVLAWMSLTGDDPFKNEEGEDRHERIRRSALPPLQAIVPEIDDDAADFITRSLSGSGTGRPDIDEWEEFIRRWRSAGVTREVTSEEAREIRERALRQSRSTEGILKARRWFRGSGWKLFTVVAAGAVILAFVSAPLRKALETPVTAGMSAIQVAAVYYEAITSMDTEVLDDCLARKAGSQDARMVEVLFVTSRVRQGYEGIGTPPTAEEWIRDGKPELGPGLYPWGVSDLKLKDLGEDRVEARYLFWAPPEGSDVTDMSPQPISRTDILTFAPGRKSLEIIRIDRRDTEAP